MPSSPSKPPTPPDRARPGRRLNGSSRSLRALLDAAPEAVVAIDHRDRIVFCNGMAASLWQRGADEMEGMPVSALFAPGFGFLRLDAAPGESFATEAEALRGDGTPFTVRLTLRRAEAGRSVFRVLWLKPAGWERADEVARTESRVHEALQALAAGLGHDLNNVLTGVLGNLRLAMDEGGPSGGMATAERLEDLHEAGLRGKELARSLLDFAKGETPSVRPCNASTLAWESVMLGLGGSRASLELDVAPGLWSALADPSHLTRALQHLAGFASALCGPGGSLRLSARNETVASAEESHGGRLLPGDFVVLSLAVPGARMREEDLRRLFHPYGDAAGIHTGMRLAMARMLVERQEGLLRAERCAGGGIAFHLHLPACAGFLAGPGACLDLGPQPLALRILVMDDEQLVRLVLQRTLESLGHRVRTVSDGAEAISAYRQAMAQGDRFDLVILDLRVATGMGGKEACRWIADHDPLATCVLSSGSTQDEAMLACRNFGFAATVEKPFDRAAIARLIEGLAGERPEPAGPPSPDEDLVGLSGDNILEVDFTNPGRY